MIQVNDLSKRYGANSPLILDRLSFEIPAGDSLSVIGPSGCGKTTLLHILARLLSATEGSVLINQNKVNGAGDKTALIFQDFGLLPWKTAWENTALGLVIRKTPKKLQREILSSLFEDLGISALKSYYPVQLSGGEKQRVAIARALAVKPELLLMDEPFSALDAMTREKLQNIILARWKQKDFMMVLVTHNIEEAAFLGKRVMVLSKGPARIIKMIENPGCGTDNYRVSSAYFDVIKELRNTVDE